MVYWCDMTQLKSAIQARPSPLHRCVAIRTVLRRAIPFVGALLISVSSLVRADAPQAEDPEALPRPALRASEPPPNRASDASFDKRLPPVLPGEEMNDSGKKLNVWSTAGSVGALPPSAPPAPPSVDVSGTHNGAYGLPPGVIVDNRGGDRDRHPPHYDPRR